MPCSRACASVSPTEPISGSVNVTLGTAWYSAAWCSVPRMSAITMPAWYMDMWVNAPVPTMSPIAQTPGAARIRSSTGIGPGLLVDAHRARADPGQVDPPSRSHQQPLGAQHITTVQRHGERRAVVADLARRDAGAHADALAGEDLRKQVTGLGFLERHQPAERLDHGDPRAEPGEDLGELDPDRAAAEHDE